MCEKVMWHINIYVIIGYILPYISHDYKICSSFFLVSWCNQCFSHVIPPSASSFLSFGVNVSDVFRRQTKNRDTNIKQKKQRERGRERQPLPLSLFLSFHQLASSLKSPGYLKPWQQQVPVPIWNLELHLVLTKRKSRLIWRTRSGRPMYTNVSAVILYFVVQKHGIWMFCSMTA